MYRYVDVCMYNETTVSLSGSMNLFPMKSPLDGIRCAQKHYIDHQYRHTDMHACMPTAL